MRGIGRILRVSNVSVLNWIKKAGEILQEVHEAKQGNVSCEVIELDELHHYIQKNKTYFSCGWQLIVPIEKSLTSSAVAVVRKVQNS